MQSKVVIVRAEYDESAAVAYAEKYAENNNSSYYYFKDADCTNFVSQCVAHGGIVSYVPAKYPSAPLITQKYKLDTRNQFWYMVKKNRLIGYDYWVYSKTWSCVTDFRKYFLKNDNEGSNDCAKVMSYARTTWKRLYPRLKVGDILQYDTGEYRHSIIITEVKPYSNGTVDQDCIKFCAHGNSKKDIQLSEFITAARKYEVSSLYHISFE